VTLSDGRRHHLTRTRDKTGKVRTYIDGREVTPVFGAIGDIGVSFTPEQEAKLLALPPEEGDR
jgi:hypothetical protein